MTSRGDQTKGLCIEGGRWGSRRVREASAWQNRSISGPWARELACFQPHARNLLQCEFVVVRVRSLMHLRSAVCLPAQRFRHPIILSFEFAAHRRRPLRFPLSRA